MAWIKPSPWDTAVFGMPCWELVEYSEAALREAANTPGHHTIRVDPLADKKLLHRFGFYYCDTLLEPWCDATRLRKFSHPDADVSRIAHADPIREICRGAFIHGRFHRDFQLSRSAADLRYENWLNQLIEAGQVFTLAWQRQPAGFIGYSGHSLVLHAVATEFRGKGLAKYWWSLVCRRLLDSGHPVVNSSVSAANLAVVNLYASLGFSFGHARDMYHCVVR